MKKLLPFVLAATLMACGDAAQKETAQLKHDSTEVAQKNAQAAAEAKAKEMAVQQNTPALEKGIPAAEEAEIKRVLGLLGKSDASVIRNGRPMSGREAEKHFIGKMLAERDNIKSFNDFILICATQSKGESKPYSVNKKDGTIVTLPEFLRELQKQS